MTSLIPDTAIAEIASTVGWQQKGDRDVAPDRWLRIALEEMPDETFLPLRSTHVVAWQGTRNGVDLPAPTGTPVYAVADGEVTWSGPRDVSGKLVRIRHEATYQSHYAHLSDIVATVRVGTRVKRGDLIGHVGSTGLAAEPHLHFAISINGRYVDPEPAMLPRSHRLEGEELAEFHQLVDRVAMAPKRAD